MFFDEKQATRMFGPLLVMICLNEEKGGKTGIEINRWFVEKIMFLQFPESQLPSSFIYPLLQKLSGGHVPWIIKDKEKYVINPDISSDKYFREDFQNELKSAEKFFGNLKSKLSALSRR